MTKKKKAKRVRRAPAPAVPPPTPAPPPPQQPIDRRMAHHAYERAARHLSNAEELLDFAKENVTLAEAWRDQCGIHVGLARDKVDQASNLLGRFLTAPRC